VSDAAAKHDQTGGEGESPDQRINRELIELLNELRVALPGVQVLFAFLLAVPFANGFATVTDFQRDLFFGTLLSTAVSSALLIAPSAYHRLNFRGHDKEQMLKTSNGLFLAGLLFLALSLSGSIVLIADFLYGTTVPVVAGAAAIAVFAALWFILPMVRRNRADMPRAE